MTLAEFAARLEAQACDAERIGASALVHLVLRDVARRLAEVVTPKMLRVEQVTDQHSGVEAGAPLSPRSVSGSAGKRFPISCQQENKRRPRQRAPMTTAKGWVRNGRSM